MNRDRGGFLRGVAALRKGFQRAETAVICVLLLSMIVVSVLPIIARWIDWKEGFFARPLVQQWCGWLRDLTWASTYLKLSVLWITVLGAALATKDRNHINIDVVGRLLKGRWKAACQTLTNLFAALVCAGVTWACWQFVIDERRSFISNDFGSTGTIFGGAPAWYAMAIMPLAFALMAVRFCIQTVEDAVGVWQGVAVEPSAALPAAGVGDGSEAAPGDDAGPGDDDGAEENGADANAEEAGQPGEKGGEP